MVAVTAHFLDSNWVLRSFLLGLKKLNISHTAVNVSALVTALANSWELNHQFSTITTDAAANMLASSKTASRG